MTLENLLLKADEVVLNQFEKVTRKAHAELGWNKYDLKNICDTAGSLGMSANGVYLILGGVVSDVPLAFPLLALCGMTSLGMGYLIHTKKRVLNQALEQAEIKILALSGAAVPPQLEAYRLPLSGALQLVLGFSMGNISGTGSVNVAMKASIGSLMWANFFFTLGDYFQNCTMTPPSTKKSFWKTLYEKTLDYVAPKPQPETAPAPVPKNYQLVSLL